MNTNIAGKCQYVGNTVMHEESKKDINYLTLFEHTKHSKCRWLWNQIIYKLIFKKLANSYDGCI